MGTIASEETSISLFADESEKSIFYPEDGGSRFFRNIGSYTQLCCVTSKNAVILSVILFGSLILNYFNCNLKFWYSSGSPISEVKFLKHVFRQNKTWEFGCYLTENTLRFH
jgi:hypothetical protein